MTTYSRSVISISQLRLLIIFCSVGMSQLFTFHQRFFVMYFFVAYEQNCLLHSKMGLCTFVSAIPLRLWYCNSRYETEPVAMLGRRELLHRAMPFFCGERHWQQLLGMLSIMHLFCCMSPILWLTGSGDVEWVLERNSSYNLMQAEGNCGALWSVQFQTVLNFSDVKFKGVF